MQFLYPTFLFALAALAIPIILHLFYFRRFKKVYFTNVRFLREVKEETSARSKLRNLLVLLMRLLALAFLVLAFAQPFIPVDKEVKVGTKAISIFIDNSFSMNALSQDVPLLEKARQRAREIIEAYQPDDVFQILTNDFEGRHQRLVSQEDALSLIEEIKPTPSVKELSKVLVRQNQALSDGQSENLMSYVISDFQKNITDIENYQDTSVAINLIPLQSVQERNISIDSAWFEAPVQMMNQNNALVVRVRNLSNEDVDNIRLTSRQGDETKPVGTLTIPAHSSVLDTVNISILKTGWQDAELTITDYPIQFDDKYYFTFKVAEEIKVLVINEEQPNRYLDAAFSGINSFKLTSLNSRNLDYSQFSNFQLIVANELNTVSSGLAFELVQFVKNGGNLLVFPNRNANIGTYQSFLASFPADELQSFEVQERRVGNVNTDEFVFNGVFENKSANLKLPVTQGNFRLTDFSNRKGEPLLTYRDGNQLLLKYQVGQGNLYLSAAPISDEYSDLVRNGEIFIPMLYKMAISSGIRKPIAYTIGRDEVLETDHLATSGDIVYKLKGKTEEFIPEQRVVGSKVFLAVNNEIPEAGFYRSFLNPEETLDHFAFNYDRKESVLEYYNESDLQDFVGDVVSVIRADDNSVITNIIAERSQGIVLWRWCIILALLFLAFEILLLRFWKA
ncbi:MAG: membrane protein [Saprospiraceae bacterium]|nr:MAG: membrane protein [Saprospiraceae bacterium]